MYCQPGEFPAVSNILYHNRGDGTFEDVSVPSGIAAKRGHGLGVAFADYDGDGFTDIFVANDVTDQFLFHNNGNDTFTEVALDSGNIFRKIANDRFCFSRPPVSTAHPLLRF